MVGAGRPDDPAAAARAEVDELHDTVERAALAGSGVGEDSWQDKVDAAGKLIDARLSWHDAGSGTKQSERLVIASDGATIVARDRRVHRARAMPIRRCSASARPRSARSIPASIAAERVALSLAPEPAPRRSRPPPARRSSRPRRARRSDRSRSTPARQARHRPRARCTSGSALVVLAAVFWWNRTGAASATRRRATAMTDDASPPTPGEPILIVDDEKNIRRTRAHGARGRGPRRPRGRLERRGGGACSRREAVDVDAARRQARRRQRPRPAAHAQGARRGRHVEPHVGDPGRDDLGPRDARGRGRARRGSARSTSWRSRSIASA